MACRWRIRHKLMLALFTVGAVMALLLLGTFKGLWSYYLTMKSMGSKLVELDEAEKLKTAVADLPVYQTVKDRKDAQLQEKMNDVRRALADYLRAFQSTVDRELETDDPRHIEGILGQLDAQLGVYKQAAELALPPFFLNGEVKGFDEQYRNSVKPIHDFMNKTSEDLRDAIRKGLTRRIEESRRYYQISLIIIIAASVGGVILILSLCRAFYRWIHTPVRDLHQGVQHLTRGEFQHRIEVHSGDEMEELAAAFNDMTQRLHDVYADLAHQVNERSRQLVRSERLASVGFLAAGVAHEINNPLASIAFCSEALEARLGELTSSRDPRATEVFAKYLKMIQDEAFRCKNITERLLEFSRGGERKRDRTDLTELVQAVLDFAQLLPQARGKEIVFVPATPVTAWVNAEDIKSVVLNLVINALDSMEEGGRLTIQMRQQNVLAEMSFSDTGCGMTAEVLENIFEPFYTRSRTGQGTGLGLTITHQIISQHGGEIGVTSAGPNQGSTFTVRLPLQASAKEPAPETLDPRGYFQQAA